ncbi:hypothetical protein [Acidocella sp.]|uniref:hypothetical protein n=1 Tax=Acidocella sp. TaxID=50710 RepID=UPI003D057964
MTSRRDRGFALLVVLWSLVLITLLITTLLASGRTDTRLANNIRDAAMARAAADGAINETIFHLLGHDGGWAEDGPAHELAVGRSMVWVQVHGLAGKINPNLASTALLAGLFQAVGMAPQQAKGLARAVIAWRSKAATAQDREDLLNAYRRAGLPYGPPAKPFADLGEIANVMGMTPTLLARLRPHLNLYQSGDPNAALADPVVREALKLSGQTGARTGIYEGNATVVIVEAQARGPGHTLARRRAIVSLSGEQGVSAYKILSLTNDY